jgi:hypothetical protein
MKTGFVAGVEEPVKTRTPTSRSSRDAWIAAASYLLVAIVATWPLVLGLGRDVPRDLGDSVLTMWILAWDSDHFVKLLHGNSGALAGFFDANIFYPARLTLAYSEHFIPQAVQSFPVYLASHNPILCYNLLFLSSFVLAGVGAFLLTRELTGSTRAGLIGGLLFAFAPYRIAQTSHLHVLSAQWMPFTLWAFSRYVSSRRLRWLIGAAVALLVQSLSSGYYLLYFPVFAATYVVWELWRHGQLRNRRVWLRLSLAACAVALLIVPLLLPYVAVRAQTQGTRSATEVVRYSADIYSYGTAFSQQPLWGQRMRAFPKPEGELFPGLVTLILGVIGLVAWRSSGADVSEGLKSKTSPATSLATESRGWKILWIVCGLASASYFAATLVTLLYRRVTLDAGLFRVRMVDASRPFAIAVGLLVLMCVLSPVARARVRAFLATRGFFVVALIAAVWLSLGPLPQSLGRPLALASPYGFLYDHVPGWDGVRAPARFATIAVLMLSVLAAFGAAWLDRLRTGRWILLAVACLFLVESLAVPMEVNGVTPPEGFATPASRIYRPGRAPGIYKAIAGQGQNAVVAELPLGQPDYDLRAVYYSVTHWRPVLNGYSGFFPPHYGQLVTALSDIPRHPDVAVDALRAAGATLVVVHETAFVDDIGRNTSAALRKRGAIEVFQDNGDVLFDVTRAR